MKKYFICSDIHSDYDALITALKDSHFDFDNKDNILIVAGDIFDRNEDSVKVYKLLKQMYDENKAIILQGNHHSMLIDFLEKKNLGLAFFNFSRNGLNATIDDFLHQTLSWDMFIVSKYTEKEQKELTREQWNKEWCDFVKYASNLINNEYPDLLKWLKDMPDYLELKNSIVTHGMIDCNSENWRYPKKGWNELHWATPKDSAFMKNTTGKHIYLGHIDTRTIRKEYGEKESYDIYTRPSGDITYLDSCTILTHKLNMIVIEDDPIE